MPKPIGVEINEGQSNESSCIFNRGDAAVEHLRKILSSAKVGMEYCKRVNMVVTAASIQKDIEEAEYFLRFGENKPNENQAQKTKA